MLRLIYFAIFESNLRKFVDDKILRFIYFAIFKSNLRKFVDDKISRSIYFAIFESNLNYCSIVSAQNYNTINCLVILQAMAFRTSILKFKDKIDLENLLFISKSINNSYQ